MNKLFIFIIMSVFVRVYSQTDSLFLNIPDRIYTTTSSNFSIYYTNLIQSNFEKKENIVVNCSVGYVDSMKYNLSLLQSGIYDLNINIFDSLGVLIEEDSSEIIVTEDSISIDTLKVFMIGDSFTYVGVYEKYIKDMYETGGKNLEYLGTNYNYSFPVYGLDNDIFHEGYSSQNWDFFASDLESPFVFPEDGLIDCVRYFEETLNGKNPDIVTIFLGISDITNCDPSSIQTIDLTIDNIFSETKMMKVINSMTYALPNAQIGIVLTPPANEREYTYTDTSSLNYSERKKAHHRLAERYEEYFKNLNNPNISVIPVNVNIDTFLGFGETDPIHPNGTGYMQIAHSIYGWIKYQISRIMQTPLNLNIQYNTAQVNLTWNKVQTANNYRIYRSTEPYSGFIEIGTSTIPSYTDADISSSNKYFYKVTSENSYR